MYYCPHCSTRYTAEQPCFCHPREAQAHAESTQTAIDSLRVESLTMEGMLRSRDLQ